MLLMSTFGWILVIGVAVAILVVIGIKLKDRYY